MGQITIIALLSASLMAATGANAQTAGNPTSGSRASDADTDLGGGLPRSIGAAQSAKGGYKPSATAGAKDAPTRTMDLTRPSVEGVSRR